LTLILSEKDAHELLDMKEVVLAVEEAFRRKGSGEVSNNPRTRSRGPSSVLNVMHANLPYLVRGGLKAYMSSRGGAKFVIVLFDGPDSMPLAVMGADYIGRFRTGAAAAVATKHLFGERSMVLALFGTGKQALTQVLAIQAIAPLEGVRVWSPNSTHRESFVRLLEKHGFKATSHESPEDAVRDADVVSSITSSKEPFMTEKSLASVSHLNISGSNDPERAEVTAKAVRSFDTIVVDDLPQARVEYGDLIQAFISGDLRWDDAVELSDVLSGKRKPRGRTLFKSGGVAFEDVAVASLLYEKARKSGKSYPNVELV
jgi:ornithine cyclodeaminase/alanine dehydrogenase-like protein (mu-crystallin family)